MSNTLRTTRECSFDQLHPELRQAIRSYFQERELGDPAADAVLCCETLSGNKDVGKAAPWLGSSSDTTIHTGVLLTSQHLIWVHHGDQTGIRLNAAKLSEIQADIHASLFSRDTGLEIVGFISDARSRVRGYIGMGTEPAAQKFCEAVKQATLKANPPKPRKLFGVPME